MLGLPRNLWLLIGAGLAVRLTFAFAFVGVEFDIESFQVVQREVATDGLLGVYGNVNEDAMAGDAEILRWPYPPGFFPWIGVSAVVENLTPLPFYGLIKLLSIFCDLALAVCVFVYLGWRGAGSRTRMAASALVLLGPSFILISGYAGQIDSVAILPAVLGLMAFERLGGPRREIVAGLLIGMGIAIKWIPAFALVAVLPALRNPKELFRLGLAAAAIPVLITLPFLLADPDGFATVIGYSGAPGLGGLGLAVQPSLVELWLELEGTFQFSPVSQFLYDHASKITLLGLLGTAAFVLRYRPAPIDAAVLTWLVVYAVAPNFFFQYLVWGIPFFLMAGYIWQVAALQAVVLVPAVIAYAAPYETSELAVVYVPIMLLLWVGWIVAAFMHGRRIAGAGGTGAKALHHRPLRFGSAVASSRRGSGEASSIRPV